MKYDELHILYSSRSMKVIKSRTRYTKVTSKCILGK